MSSRPFTFDRVVRMFLTVVAVIGAIWLIDTLEYVLLPFCLACLIAYLLNPIVEFNQHINHLKGRTIATILTLIEVTFVLGLVLYFCVPSILRELDQMKELIKDYSPEGVAVPYLPSQVSEYVGRFLSSENIRNMLDSDNIETILDKSTTFLSASLDFLMRVIEWLLTFVYVIFILIDYDPLMKGFRQLVPPKYRKVAYKIEDDIKTNMNHYFRGQAIIALCAAVFYCIGFSIVGIPLSIVLGILVGVLYMIPYFQYITLIPVAIVCLIYSMGGQAEFWSTFGQCLIVYAVSQSVCDYILTPKIMGKAMGLNPAIILFSLSVWGTLLGLIGMIIALPLTTLLLAYYQEYVIDRQVKNEVKNEE
ncbi:MAG: AI-2E family transporter [Muribaculaceae bacterium]|nr:AI-2E family transporter [Muribaculaceae bacterium]